MTKLNLTTKALAFAKVMLVAVVFCGCGEQKQFKEKSIIMEYQGQKVVRQMGLSDVFDTTRFYKAMFIKDSVCFKYVTDGKYNNGDIIQSER